MFRLPTFMQSARCGVPRRFQNLVFWACEGLVVCQDERPGANGKGDYRVLAPDDLKTNLNALVRFNQRNRGNGYHTWQRIRGREQLSQLQGVDDCIKEAKRMGDPSDPAVQAFWHRHRRSGTVSLSSRTDAAGYSHLPRLPRGSFTGKVAPNPDLTLPGPQNAESHVFNPLAVHTPPRRKSRSPILVDL